MSLNEKSWCWEPIRERCNIWPFASLPWSAHVVVFNRHVFEWKVMTLGTEDVAIVVVMIHEMPLSEVYYASCMTDTSCCIVSVVINILHYQTLRILLLGTWWECLRVTNFTSVLFYSSSVKRVKKFLVIAKQKINRGFTIS